MNSTVIHEDMPSKNIFTRSLRKQADSLFHENRMSEAAALYKKICRSDKRDIDARTLLAISIMQSGNFEGARVICEQALKINPEHALAHHTMGTIHDRQNKPEKAIPRFKRAIQLRPDFANAHFFLGNSLASTGEYEAARKSYLKALELDSTLIGAMTALGNLYTQTGNINSAISLFRKALLTKPDNPGITASLANALSAFGDQDEALLILQNAKQLGPDSYEINFSLGNLLMKLGRYDDAIACYKTALATRPDDEYAIGAIAQILERRGQFDEAALLLKPHIDTGTSNAGITLPFAELSAHSGNFDAAILALENTLGNKDLGQPTRIELHYKLGKLLDRTESYDDAFEHYRKGNLLTGNISSGLDVTETINSLTDRILKQAEQCDSDFWSAVPVADNNSERPVFVVGMPRSGTTLTEQILASHPDVYGAGELAGIDAIARSLKSLPQTKSEYPASLEDVPAHILKQAADHHLQLLEKLSRTSSRIVDKYPHNFLHLGLISILYPKAKIIHITRDPRDTCLSIYFQIFSPRDAYANDLVLLGQHYKTYQKLMDHWNEVLNIPILNIKYEELVSSPEQTIRHLTDFCGLTWNDSCLEFHQAKRDVSTPSYDQIRQPLYNRSVGRWEHYRNHIGKLLDTLAPDKPS